MKLYDVYYFLLKFFVYYFVLKFCIVVHGPPSCSVHYMSASSPHASLLPCVVDAWIPKGHFSSFHCCVMLSVFVLYIILDFILYICSCSFICPLGARAMRAVHGAPHISFGANVVLEFPGFEPETLRSEKQIMLYVGVFVGRVVQVK